MPGVRHPAADPPLHRLRIDGEAGGYIDGREAGTTEGAGERTVHTTTPIADEKDILAKKSQDVPTVWFTDRHDL
jgi:hypothetical protein